MIKTISGSPYVQITNGHPSQPYFNPGSQSAGLVRYNTSLNSMEVYDGSSWHQLSAHTTVDLSEDVKDLLSWARNKRQEDHEFKKLIEANPAIRDLYEKLEMTKVLVQRQQQEQQNS